MVLSLSENRIVVIGQDKVAEVFDIYRKEHLCSLPYSEDLLDTFLLDDKHILALTDLHIETSYENAKGEWNVGNMLVEHPFVGESSAWWAQHGHTLYIAGELMRDDNDNTHYIRTIDLNVGTTVDSFSINLAGHECNDMLVCRGRWLLLLSGYPHGIIVVDLQTKRKVQFLEGDIWEMTKSSDPHTICVDRSISGSQKIQVMDIDESGLLSERVSFPNREGRALILAVCQSRVFVQCDGTIVSHDLASGEAVVSLGPFAEELRAVVSEKRKELFVAEDISTVKAYCLEEPSL